MAELEDYGIDRQTLEKMLVEWRSGRASKSELERRYLGKTESHGKLFSSLVRRHLRVETEKSHPLVEKNRELAAEIQRLQQENSRLRAALRAAGLPEDPGAGW